MGGHFLNLLQYAHVTALTAIQNTQNDDELFLIIFSSICQHYRDCRLLTTTTTDQLPARALVYFQLFRLCNPQSKSPAKTRRPLLSQCARVPEITYYLWHLLPMSMTNKLTFHNFKNKFRKNVCDNIFNTYNRNRYS